VKRALISLIVGAGLMISPGMSFAASTPLAPGGAAGVRQAQSMNGVPIYAIVGGVLVIVGFVAVLADNHGGHASSTTCAGADGSRTGCPSSTTTTH
jgi:hypothetical protein